MDELKLLDLLNRIQAGVGQSQPVPVAGGVDIGNGRQSADGGVDIGNGKQQNVNLRSVLQGQSTPMLEQLKGTPLAHLLRPTG